MGKSIKYNYDRRLLRCGSTVHTWMNMLHTVLLAVVTSAPASRVYVKLEALLRASTASNVFLI